MNTHLSLFGMFHTAVSVLPIGFGFLALLRDGKIDPRNWTGKLYLATMLIGSATSFGLLRHGFNVAHVLSIITIALLAAGIAAARSNWFGRAAAYIETISLSASFLLLMVFTTTETLTRLPVNHPIASGPDAPILGIIRLGLLVAFLSGISYQIRNLRVAGREPNDLATQNAGTLNHA